MADPKGKAKAAPVDVAAAVAKAFQGVDTDNDGTIDAEETGGGGPRVSPGTRGNAS